MTTIHSTIEDISQKSLNESKYIFEGKSISENSFMVFINSIITNSNTSFADRLEIERNSISKENDINNNRLYILEKTITRQLISYILDEDFEYGIESKAHTLVKEQMAINSIATKDWLNRIYVDNFNNTEVLIGILRVIARFEREEIYPIGETIALASLSHKDEVVQENAIRAFESWGGQESLEILENVSISSSWVKEYLLEVISDLKSVYACKEN